MTVMTRDQVKVRNPGLGQAASAEVTVHAGKGLIETESLTTAAGAAYTLTLNNERIRVSSVLLAAVTNNGNTQGIPIVGQIKTSDGQATIEIRNIDGANAFNGALRIYFMVF